MIRRSNGNGLVKRRLSEEEDVNPSNYLSNMADCMLVLAVGLMIALVAHYGVDMSGATQVEQGQEVSRESIQDNSGSSDDADGGDYTQLGTVYMDKTSGKWYMIPEDGSSGD